MEALFFRSLAQALPPLLLGRRLEHIHCPRPNWWTLRLQTSGQPRYLLFAHHPSSQALALSERRPENPVSPPAQVMWLRKRTRGSRIVAFQADWSSRRLALGLTLGLNLGQTLGLKRQEPETWMILDARTGPSLQSDKPLWPEEPAWPALSDIHEKPDIWQSFPHISPLLRKTLLHLQESEKSTLYSDLQRDAQHVFYVYKQDRAPCLVCTWPLPPNLCRAMQELQVTSALEAATMLAESVFFPVEKHMDAESVRTEKKRTRVLKRLEADEQRMRGYCKLADQAQLLRTHLYQLPVHERLSQVTITGPDAHQDTRSVNIALDQRKTVLENMEHWFRLAEKGRRGLAHVRKRRELLLSNRTPAHFEHGPARPTTASVQSHGRRGTTARPSLPVHRFLSSDGFTMLRGKNQKANHALLTRQAGPDDLWFHAEQGPGAHVILKRNAPRQAVPDQSMREAAILAGLASHFAQAGRASIICAEVRHVRPVKGSPGMARVERAHATLLVDLDPKLESRLKVMDTP